MTRGSMTSLGSILILGCYDRLEETFHGPGKARIFRRVTEGR